MATVEHAKQIPVIEQLKFHGSNVNPEGKVAVNFNVKHPLQNAWTLWYDNPNKRNNDRNWLDNLKKLVTFNTVEEFWGVYDNVVKASDIPEMSDYHLFKAGVKPMWEDPANEKGGKWVAQFDRGVDIDRLWRQMLLSCIGESFEHEDEICGVVLGVRRKFYRVSLWTRTTSVKHVTESIGRQFKNILEVNEKKIIQFTSHEAPGNVNLSGPLYHA